MILPPLRILLISDLPGSFAPGATVVAFSLLAATGKAGAVAGSAANFTLLILALLGWLLLGGTVRGSGGKRAASRQQNRNCDDAELLHF